MYKKMPVSTGSGTNYNREFIFYLAENLHTFKRGVKKIEQPMSKWAITVDNRCSLKVYNTERIIKILNHYYIRLTCILIIIVSRNE